MIMPKGEERRGVRQGVGRSLDRYRVAVWAWAVVLLFPPIFHYR
jgi:hypothetical protein